MTIFAPFILFILNRVWFKSGISSASQITKQTFYSIFHNRSFTLNLKWKLKGKWSKKEKR